MGAIEFLIYDNGNIKYNIDFIKSFMNIKCRGYDETIFTSLSTDDLNNLNAQSQLVINSTLSKHEIKTYKQYNFKLGYHRHSINDISYNGAQPFIDPIEHKKRQYPDLKRRPTRYLLCNGEIYNYNKLVMTNKFTDKDLSSFCDVEVILPLYIKFKDIIKTINELDGDFAFILTENINTFELSNINIYAVRDFLGIKPLYYINNISNDMHMFVSEIKALPINIINNMSYQISHVKPGTFWSFQDKKFIEYYSLESYKDLDNCIINSTDPDTLNSIYTNIHTLVNNSIISRYNNSEKNVGILLSGGFDSCLITSLLIKHLISINHNFIDNPLHIFTVGDSIDKDDYMNSMYNSSNDHNEKIDCEYAVQFVNYLETKYGIDLHHHVININNIDILKPDLDDIIITLETYEPEVIKESIPLYYLLRYIKQYTDVKILLSGDGLDELFGGYNEFKNIEDQDFQNKTVNLLQNLHKLDILRTDRISGRFGLEIRQPYLNKQFIEYVLSIHPKIKRAQKYSSSEETISKYIIRNAFDKHIYGEELLPHDNLWRVSKCLCCALTNFESRIHEYFDTHIPDEVYDHNYKLLLNENQNPKTLPTTKEEMFYRLTFRKKFPNRDYLVENFWLDEFNNY